MTEKKPVRIFHGIEGQRSVDDRGPEAIIADFDTLCRMFDPLSTHKDGIQGGISTTNIRDGIFTDGKIGPRTVNDAITGTISDTGTFTQLLSWMARMIRTTTGEANWRTSPTKTFQQVTQDAESAVLTAGLAQTTAGQAVVTANQANTQSTTATTTANTALGQATVEPFTGALGAMEVATRTKHAWETAQPEIDLAVMNAQAAVVSVAEKASVAYVDNAVAGVVLGQVPDGSIADIKLSNDPAQIKTRVSVSENNIQSHLADDMPHRFLNTDTAKVYRYGLLIEEGHMKFIYEEVL